MGCPSFYTISQEKLYLEANDRDNKVINNKANNSSVVLLDPVNKFVLSRVCTCHSICIIYAVLLYGLWFLNCSDFQYTHLQDHHQELHHQNHPHKLCYYTIKYVCSY